MSTPDSIRAVETAVKAAMFDVTKEINDRLKQIHDDQSSIKQRLSDGDAVMQSLREELTANSKSTEEVREAFEFAKKGLKFIGSAAAFIGRVVTWAVKVGVPVGAAYAAIKDLHWWPWNK